MPRFQSPEPETCPLICIQGEGCGCDIYIYRKTQIEDTIYQVLWIPIVAIGAITLAITRQKK